MDDLERMEKLSAMRFATYTAAVEWEKLTADLADSHVGFIFSPETHNPLILHRLLEREHNARGTLVSRLRALNDLESTLPPLSESTPSNE